MKHLFDYCEVSLSDGPQKAEALTAISGLIRLQWVMDVLDKAKTQGVPYDEVTFGPHSNAWWQHTTAYTDANDAREALARKVYDLLDKKTQALLGGCP